MATSAILTVLSNIPWGQVLDAAPKVVDGATKLWSSVSRRKGDKAGKTASAPPMPQDPSLSPVEALQAQVTTLQESVAGLRDEMEAASALIKDLAEQNAVLVQRVELNRVRMGRQTWALRVLGVVVAVLLGVLFFRA